ncbi:UNVERIFIED_CONTAM: hypothetical protein FKN15_035895 [Acipenser sinensis]
MKNVGRGLKPTDHNNRENQLSNEELGLGYETKCFIESQRSLHLRQFYKDVRQFFSSAADYMIRKFPFGDEVLVHAAVADIHKRQSVSSRFLMFFINRFACLLPEGVTVDQLEDGSACISNADCERVFSLVTKNKTQHRASLSTDMLSSLVTHKIMMSAKQQVCHTQIFSDNLLRKAKSATYEAKHSRSESAV